MNCIIVPTDFSESSINSAVYAASIALNIKVDLYLIHAVQVPQSIAETPLSGGTKNKKAPHGKEKLEQLKLDLEKQTGGKINIHAQLEEGRLENHLLNICELKAPIAVVMGMKKNASDEFRFGSKTIFAIEHLHYPLFVIPNGARFNGIKKILLAYDFEDFNKRVPIEYLKKVKDAFQAEIDILHVTNEKTKENISKYEVAGLKTMLQSLQPNYYFREANTVEEGINKYIDENEVDLLMMLPKHHSLLSFHKSHTKQMALNAKVPLMTIHE